MGRAVRKLFVLGLVLGGVIFSCRGYNFVGARSGSPENCCVEGLTLARSQVLPYSCTTQYDLSKHSAAVFAMGTLATFGYGAFLIIGGVVTDPAAEFEKLEQGCYIKSFTV